LSFKKGAATWTEMVSLVENGKASRSDLTYYKEEELDLLKSLPIRPNLMLIHDWPKSPERVGFAYARRPEAELVEKLSPEFVCCGHHHEAVRWQLGQSEVCALNIITNPIFWIQGRICPGWAHLLLWDSDKKLLGEIGHWPKGPL